MFLLNFHFILEFEKQRKKTKLINRKVTQQVVSSRLLEVVVEILKSPIALIVSW